MKKGSWKKGVFLRQNPAARITHTDRVKRSETLLVFKMSKRSGDFLNCFSKLLNPLGIGCLNIFGFDATAGFRLLQDQYTGITTPKIFRCAEPTLWGSTHLNIDQVFSRKKQPINGTRT
jgi:hypothetical protein